MAEVGLPDTIVRILMENWGMLTLKNTRLVDRKWNALTLLELRKRASKGQMKAINLTWGSPNNILMQFDEAQIEMASFLEDTKEVPELFQSFRFCFPESLKVINSFPFFRFFSDYTPNFVELLLDPDLEFNENSLRALHNFLHWMAPMVQKIKLTPIRDVVNLGEFHALPNVPNMDHLVFPRLRSFESQIKKIPIEFKAILNRGGTIDKIPNLTTLKIIQANEAEDALHVLLLEIIELFVDQGHSLASIIGIDFDSRAGLTQWSNLTQISFIAFDDHTSEEMMQLLLALVQEGMALKKLNLCLWKYNDLPEICWNVTTFLESQRGSLEVLSLNLVLNGFVLLELGEEGLANKIRFPVFEKLTNLALILTFDLGFFNNRFVLEPFSFPLHFPKVKNLFIFGVNCLESLFPQGAVAEEPIPLKTLCFYASPMEVHLTPLNLLANKFKDVEIFRGEGALLEEEDLPWNNSLRELQINNVNERLRVSHLASVQKIVVCEKKLDGDLEEYLEYFDELLQLNLTSLIFKFKGDFKPSEEIKAEIINHFPIAFQVEFQNY